MFHFIMRTGQEPKAKSKKEDSALKKEALNFEAEYKKNSESRHGYDNGRVCRSLLPRQVSVIEGQEYQEQKRYDECSTVTVF